MNGHSIPTYGYWIGGGLLVIAAVGLVCVGVLIGWADRDRAVEQAYAAGQKAEREHPQRPAPHPTLTMEIPKIRHPAVDDDATARIPRWRQS